MIFYLGCGIVNLQTILYLMICAYHIEKELLELRVKMTVYNFTTDQITSAYAIAEPKIPVADLTTD